jgi:beta-glucosidase
MNPFIFGEYPDIMKKNVGSRLPFFTSRESNLVKGSIDFLGINFYYAYYVKNSAESLQKKNRDYTADTGVKIKRMIVSVSFTVLHNQFYIEFKQVAYT